MIANNYNKRIFNFRKAIELKRIISSILLFLAVSSQLGTYIVYELQQKLNKENIAQAMAKKMPEDELVKIKYSQAIQWEEAGKEFYLGGTFYDIVKTQKIKGETWFYCISDTMESQLYNKYTASLNTNTESIPLNKENKQMLKFSLSYFILYPTTEALALPTLNKRYFNSMGQETLSIALPINAPPPKLV
jgi:hypothetical protein